mmetsp:Transcript_15556/g.38537  ORF Transcript_15556/g.38537 Transcript_15556/m.38537 type:complete len:200 (+) Transcript_15556:695-1294(+)
MFIFSPQVVVDLDVFHPRRARTPTTTTSSKSPFVEPLPVFCPFCFFVALDPFVAFLRLKGLLCHAVLVPVLLHARVDQGSDVLVALVARVLPRRLPRPTGHSGQKPAHLQQHLHDLHVAAPRSQVQPGVPAEVELQQPQAKEVARHEHRLQNIGVGLVAAGVVKQTALFLVEHAKIQPIFHLRVAQKQFRHVFMTAAQR